MSRSISNVCSLDHEKNLAGRPVLSTVVDRSRAIAIAIGGILGASLRWAVIAATGPPAGFPWAVFAINVGGSAVLGAVLAEETRHAGRRLLLHDGIGIGFCGGLTTFSTFAVEVAGFLRTHRAGLAVTYMFASVVVGILAAVAGAAALRSVKALTLPLEEAP